MKRQIKKKSCAIVLAALSLCSTQAIAAIHHTDLLLTCKVFSTSSDGTKYYLKVNFPSGTGNVANLSYTTTLSSASIFTFARRDGWTHSTRGTAYYMTHGPYGGCVGLTGTTTPAVGTLVAANLGCSDVSRHKVLIENISGETTKFAIGIESTSYWFDGWGGLADGNYMKLNVANSGPYSVNQRFSTTGCKSATNIANRPRGGT